MHRARASTSRSPSASSSGTPHQRGFAGYSPSAPIALPIGMDEALRAAQRSTAAAVAVAAARAAAGGHASADSPAQAQQQHVEGGGGVGALLQSWVHDEMTGTATSGLPPSSAARGASGRSEVASSSTAPQSQAAGSKKRRLPSAGQEGEEQDNEGEASGTASDSKAKSKRAAQNRAAQKAFRERRDKYIKELEERQLHFEPALLYAQAAHTSLAAYETHSLALFGAAVQLRDQLRAAGIEPCVEPRQPVGPPPEMPPGVAGLVSGAVERSTEAKENEGAGKKGRKGKKPAAARASDQTSGEAQSGAGGTGMSVPQQHGAQTGNLWLGPLPPMQLPPAPAQGGTSATPAPSVGMAHSTQRA